MPVRTLSRTEQARVLRLMLHARNVGTERGAADLVKRRFQRALGRRRDDGSSPASTRRPRVMRGRVTSKAAGQAPRRQESCAFWTDVVGACQEALRVGPHHDGEPSGEVLDATG